MRETRLLLVGGGHSHVEVLRSLGRRPLQGVRITLISRQRDTPYSGMLPGVIAGHYTRRDSHIDLAPLVKRAGGEFTIDEAVGLDLSRRLVRRRDGPPLPWDLVSLDIGSTPATDPDGARAGAVPVKPIDGLLARWEELQHAVLAGNRRQRIAVIGAGAAGVELILSMQVRLRAVLAQAQRGDSHLDFSLFSADSAILPTYPAAVRRKFLQVLERRGVTIHLGERVVAAPGGEVVTESGRYPMDHAVWATQAAAAPWVRESGLAVDASGFMRVSQTLESVSHANVFGAGDVATIDGHRRPKAGVWAVRQGPPLARNLRARLAGQPLELHRPQSRALSLITTGDKSAVASRGPWTASGAWVWLWKDWIDRRFMRRYEVTPSEAAST